MGYLDSLNKKECFGCEACVQSCKREALTMVEDKEGFRYPMINHLLCSKCGLCRKSCPYDHMPKQYVKDKYVFGGYHLDAEIRFESTSGGAFSAIVEAFCDKDYVIFGAEAKGLFVFHSYITDKRELYKFRKSKYSQSMIGKAYRNVKRFLLAGKKVLFSGTPCQIAGLKAYLGKVNPKNLLTVEVVCEGVPSPLYIQKYADYLEKKYGSKVESLDYRYKGKNIFCHGKWDFQQMKYEMSVGGGRWDFETMRINLMNKKVLKKDRWFNPFWTIWLEHLMSRPSCYECPFAQDGRVADITLGDLWGVHLSWPELYGKNGGASLIVANTEQGEQIVKKAEKMMYGHRICFEDALRYQSPMRRPIAENTDRERFLADLQGTMGYREINRKWAKKPTLKILWKKYVWGNRQKVFAWNMRQKLFGRKK